MIHYVAVIALSTQLSRIAVLVKQKGPAHLIGKVTVPGGKVEEGETIFAAAIREFREEAGVTLPVDRLRLFSGVTGEDYPLTFVTCDTPRITNVAAQEGELEKVYLEDLATFLRMPEEAAAKDVITQTLLLLEEINA